MSDNEWVFKLVHARNIELIRLTKQLPNANAKERKIIREALKKGEIKHDGAW